MNDIVRAKVGKREKIFEYSYLGFIGLGPLGISLLEDAGVKSFWIRVLLIFVILIACMVLLAFSAVPAARRRLAADRKNGVFTCAVRFPSSATGSLRDLWDEGAAQVSDAGLAFQPTQGAFYVKPAGKKRDFGPFALFGAAEITGKKPRSWGRSWSIRELQTDEGRIHLAASTKSLALLEERSDRDPLGTMYA